MKNVMLLSILCACSAGAFGAQSPQPEWIWHSAGVPAASAAGAKPIEACFRRTVTIPAGAKVTTALLALTADASCIVYVNGTFVDEKRSDWRSVWGVKLAKRLKPGKNVLAIVSGKANGQGGLIGRLKVTFESGTPLEIVTDQQWKVSTSPAANWTSFDFDDSSWAASKELGLVGTGPWGNLNLEPSPQPVAWPVAPANRPLTPEQGAALLEADWLAQAANDPVLADVQAQIAAARQIARRLMDHPKHPNFSAELGELDRLAAKAQGVANAFETNEELTRLYLEVRQVKRRIVMRNPAVDFERVLLIDGSPPAGHESGHRNTYGGDLHRIGNNRILVLDGLRPDATARDVIPADSGGVMRMDLAFDASKLIYSLVPRGGNSYHLYEVPLGADGMATGQPRQLTNSPYHDEDPIYLPDGKIVFCTTRGNTYVRCLPDSPSTVLARCDADGGNIRIISNNSEPDYTPSLLPDGRILYTRWEYTDRTELRLEKLWTVNPDGTGLAHYWGNHSFSPDVVWEARPIPGTDRVMFAGVGHHDVNGGAIGIIDVNEGRDFPSGLYKVTADAAWTEVGGDTRTFSAHYRPCPQFERFESPYPLSSDDFLVSARGFIKPYQPGPYWLYLMDVDGNRELVYAGSDTGVWCAMPLRPRAKPPVIADRTRWPQAGEKAQPGVLYSFNVYDGVEGLPSGKAKFLRVLQQDYKTYSMGYKSLQLSGPSISVLQSDSVKRVLGIVPIPDNGMVSFKVPSSKAVYFQLLDAGQRCIQTMRSFTGVMPGEMRGCTGCHEGHSTLPVHSYNGGPLIQPVELTPPPWGADVSISYERFAQPVLDKYCGKCHQGQGKARAVLDLTLRGGVPEGGVQDPKLWPFKEPYLTLIGGTIWGGLPPTATVDPKSRGYGLAGVLPVNGGPLGPIKPMSALSYASPLIQLATSGKHHGVKIEGQDLLRLSVWIDCNCVYRGDEEVRQIPDPDPKAYRHWTVPPRTHSAPNIDRLQPVTDPVALPDKGSRASIELLRRQRLANLKFSTVDLGPCANRGFKDDKEKGIIGWSNQGEFDMRDAAGLAGTRQVLGGVPFQIAAPNSCVVLYSMSALPDTSKNLPKKVRIAIGRKADEIFFLHDSCWTEGKVCTYRMNYQDGTSADLVIEKGNQILDWITPSTVINDAMMNVGVFVAWQGHSKAFNCETMIQGLEWRNPNPAKMVTFIDFIAPAENNYKPVPILVGITTAIAPTSGS